MLPNYLPIRVALRISIFCFASIAPLAILHTALAYYIWPVPPAIILTSTLPLPLIKSLYNSYHSSLQLISLYFLLECLFLPYHSLSRLATQFVHPPPVRLATEERWRLWVKMAESDRDGEWLRGWFLKPTYREAPDGARDPAIEPRLDRIGRTNIEEWVAHIVFGKKLSQIRPKSLDRAELHSMVLLLEEQLSSRSDGIPFSFGRGRSPHRISIPQNSARTIHHPLLFYLLVWACSALGNTVLYLAGFRYYGPHRLSWPFPLFFMRGSQRALDRAQDPQEAAKMGDPFPGTKMAYWFHPGSKKAQSESLTPVMFFHGLSGTFGPAWFILRLQRLTGRPMFVPEFSYLAMRRYSTAHILTPLEVVAAARRMVWRHGFGLTDAPPAEDDQESSADGSDDGSDEWRRGKVVLCGHSLGSGLMSWVLRDAPDIVDGTVMVEPMSPWLYDAHASRNFFRRTARTAGEIFFQFFAQEAGISHFMSTHLSWHTSAVFTTTPPAPLPASAAGIVPLVAQTEQDVGWDVPYYAPSVSPSPRGPLPTEFFYADHDCVLPVDKAIKYLHDAGFEQGPEGNLHVMKGTEHAGVLFSWKWSRAVAAAVDRVGQAAETLRDQE